MEPLTSKIKICENFAIRKHNGLCLSTEYKNNSTKMLWQCEKGHQWMAYWNSVKDIGSWCPKCQYEQQIIRQKANILELKEFAMSKNGKLISIEYINALTPVIWECQYGHQWKAKWNNIKNQNQWCPKCFGNFKPNIKELQQHAINKNGKLISIEYVNMKIDLIWECSEGHQWKANWHNIKDRNSWCPECSSYKTEKLCKRLLEEKLNIKFTKIRFYYNNQRLEFDGYNEEYNIAFEYHGYQHYEFPNHWHKTENEFVQQKQRDDLKEQFAIENDIKLIIIPYTEENNLEKYINNFLRENTNE